jgi:neutral ceramidase
VCSSDLTKTFKKDDQFTKGSTDDERWLDTMLHALLFERTGGKRSLLWYHFSAHSVCFADDLAGPDWPGMVAELARTSEKLSPSFLQGHCGDVNPGDGSDWRGEANQTVKAVYPALQRALATATRVKVDRLRARATEFPVPLDLALLKDWLARYQKDPAKCTGGEWVDASFAQAWFRDNVKRNPEAKTLPIPLSAVQLGGVGLVFHPAELYSFYGLAIRRDSPLADTLVVGYADDCLGYLPDPNAFKAGEYAAIVVPKILDLGPFTPTAAREMTAAAVELLKKTVA